MGGQHCSKSRGRAGKSHRHYFRVVTIVSWLLLSLAPSFVSFEHSFLRWPRPLYRWSTPRSKRHPSLVFRCMMLPRWLLLIVRSCTVFIIIQYKLNESQEIYRIAMTTLSSRPCPTFTTQTASWSLRHPSQTSWPLVRQEAPYTLNSCCEFYVAVTTIRI